MDKNISAAENAVYILDSYGLIYRAYYALFSHPLTNQRKENISAVVIFFRNLKALLAKYNPAYIAAAFDSRTKTFRHELFAEYKATRQKTPDDLHAQVPWIEDVLKALGIPVLRVDGFEADDIIATVAAKCAKEGRQLRILSGDKDLLQLVTETCKEMQPDKANGGWETDGIEEVKAKWGIPPEMILDYLSLTGDAADNVPGVKGVGDKTAVKLLTQYGSLDGIYEHAEEIKGALGQKIRGDKENAYFSKKLISLRSDVPVDIDFDSFSTANLDYAAAGKALAELGAEAVSRAFLKEGNADWAIASATALPAASAKESAVEAGALSAKSATPAKEDNAPLPIRKNEGNYRPITSSDELKKFLDSALDTKTNPCLEVAFDTETDGLDTHASGLVGFSLCIKEGEAVYVPVVLPGGMFAEETLAKEDCLAQLERILKNPDATLVMHNGKFDLEVLYTAGLDLAQKPLCKIADTMVAAWLLDPDALGKSPYGLEYLAETKLGLCGIEFNDIVQKGKTFADVPLEKAYRYGAEDADFTLQLWNILKKQMEAEGLNDIFFKTEMPLLPILAAMENRGIHLDKKILSNYNVELCKIIEEKKSLIYSEAGHEFNIASTKQLQEVLFTERGLVPGKKTKTGYSTDTAVLEELAERTEDPLPNAILDFRKSVKLQNTYVETLPLLADKNGRIHTSFMQTGTATGRLSSRDPNLQNIPVREEAGRKIRSAFTAEKGTVLISADYSQIELVVLAHLSGDKNLSSAFEQGVDVHKATAALIYGIKADDVSADMRRFAKTVNFGVMYGMSAFRLAKDLGISRTEAQNFISQYFTTYSQVKAFIEKTIADARANGFTQTITGRRRFIRGINSRNKNEQQAAERIAINTPIQGSAADIVKKAMIDVNQEIERTGSPLKMLLQVHDELIFECPDDDSVVKSSIELIRAKMESAFKLNVPLRVSIESGKSWGQFH
ncbi:MAG: DNA polymerase I [Treponema sp.]|nr:DNA polymerase I [Treponema sp.]